MRSTGIPINFGITVALGFIVGAAIAGQTFYLFTLDNLKQFGGSRRSATSTAPRRDDSSQAAVVGVVGYGWESAWRRRSSSSPTKRPNPALWGMYLPWQIAAIAAIAVSDHRHRSSLLCIRECWSSNRRRCSNERSTFHGAAARACRGW